MKQILRVMILTLVAMAVAAQTAQAFFFESVAIAAGAVSGYHFLFNKKAHAETRRQVAYVREDVELLGNDYAERFYPADSDEVNTSPKITLYKSDWRNRLPVIPDGGTMRQK